MTFLTTVKQAVTLYINEIEIMCRMRHANIVRIYGCTQPPEAVFIVMEYCPSNLSQLIHRWTRIPVPLLLKIAKGIANGYSPPPPLFFFFPNSLIPYLRLLYLHKHAKIIHRDMKPSNVLLDEHNTPKIAGMLFHACRFNI